MDKKKIEIEKFFTLAIEQHGLNNLSSAQELYNQVLTIDPNHLLTHKNLAPILFSQKEYQKAKNCYAKIIEIMPNYVEAYYNQGVILQALKENLDAKDNYEKAIELNPKFPEAHNNLGNIFRELGDTQKAKDCYEKAIELNPNYANAHNNLGAILQATDEVKAKECFEKAIEIDPNYVGAHNNLSSFQIRKLDNFEKAIITSHNSLTVKLKSFKFINQSIPLFRLKHDVQQAQYLISKDYALEGIKQFQKIGEKILERDENKNENNYNKKILLNKDEINSLLPFYKSDYIYKPKKISGSCINPNKNWQDVEDEYFNSSNQIMHIDNFLSEEAIHELREFCLVSKVWNKEYNNKYLGAYSNQGFISPIHLQIAVDLKQKLPKLFGPHPIEKFWAFKYDTTLGKGINIHADFAIHNLNFWITPDEYNNNKNSGGLKVYDAPAPDNWTFKDYNLNSEKSYKFLKDNNANCTNIPYKFNRAVLFNSAYFHETDQIDFKDEYEGRRINNTYLFGDRIEAKPIFFT